MLREKQILAGFDGFIDTIVKPVRRFGAGGKCEYFDTIAEFGAFIGEHSHKSTSIQYEIQRRKPGGNMPNFIMALDALGLNSVAVGMMSAEAGGIDPLFRALGKLRYSYSNAGPAAAFEFNDGKILFSSANVHGVNNDEKMYPQIERAFPGFSGAVAAADCTAFLNWSELPFAQDLWDDIYIHTLDPIKRDKKRFVFFDLCDTSAKSPMEIEALFTLIGKFSDRRRTVLSLNKNEALDICGKVAGQERSVTEAAELLFQRLSVDELVVHQHTESMSFSAEGVATEQCALNKNPKISTGAGDHFNAAYCCASLAALSAAEKLRFANAYSGTYVSKGASPGLQDIEYLYCSSD
jgi:hypothetical protein